MTQLNNYHPCTSILIEALRNMKDGDKVLKEWDKKRQVVDKEWQAAKADSESEIAIALAQLDRLISRNDELQAHINVLREALENLHDDIAEYQKLNNIGGYENQCMKQARQALASTPAQSLAQHDDEVIERCAKSCENLITESFSKPLSFDDIAIAIRALKGKYE